MCKPMYENHRIGPINAASIVFKKGNLRGVLKKTLLKEMCDFLTLEILPIALMLIKRKICHLFLP